MITLFIGRFQPFHNGHLHDILKAATFSEKIIIGVGSSQKSNTKENPFSFEERKEMIDRVLHAHAIPHYEILAIPDIHNEEKWVDHVCSIVNDFDIVYTGNSHVRDLFEEKGFAVKDVILIPSITATEIRKRIANDDHWHSLVPNEIVQFIEKVKGMERIRNMHV
jgi:nicotinamide-nucleotide adenylyltransferase